MGAMKQQKLFGGNWTDEKLQLLSKYLTAYATIMNKQPFDFAYIDAFAGTGYREVASKQEETKVVPLFPDIVQKEPQEFMDGSARIALQIEPVFNKFIFIEEDPKRFEQLADLQKEFSALADRITLINKDCNEYLQDRCLNYDWTSVVSQRFSKKR